MLAYMMCALAVAGTTVPVFATDARTEIRVRLMKQVRAVEVSGFSVQVSPPSGYVSAAFNSELTKVKIRKVGRGLFKVIWPSRKVQMIEGNFVIVRGQMLRIGLDPVPYDFALVENGNANFDVVAKMNLDRYLAGVLPSEMPIGWPIEALKAQAVAARSYVLRVMQERSNQSFDVDSSVVDQVYKYRHEDDIADKEHNKIEKILSSTRGEVLTDERGRVLKAFYHADCGCQTEDPKFVWGPSKYFASVKDPTCNNRKTHRWNLSLVWSEVQSKLAEHFDLPVGSKLDDLSIVSRTPSGRVALLAANFKTNANRKLSFMLNAQNFRKIFGFQKVASTHFNFQQNGEQLRLEGQGLGHGVGLCQWGAKALAIQGSNYQEILKSFYPKAFFKSRRNI